MTSGTVITCSVYGECDVATNDFIHDWNKCIEGYLCNIEIAIIFVYEKFQYIKI